MTDNNLQTQLTDAIAFCGLTLRTRSGEQCSCTELANNVHKYHSTYYCVTNVLCENYYMEIIVHAETCSVAVGRSSKRTQFVCSPYAALLLTGKGTSEINSIC